MKAIEEWTRVKLDCALELAGRKRSLERHRVTHYRGWIQP
jgi:hypothetical protein